MFQDRRWKSFLPRLLAYLMIQFGVLALCGRYLFGSTKIAVIFAGVAAAMIGIGAVLYAETAWSDRPARWRRWLLVGFWAVTFGLCAGAGLHFWLATSWPVAVLAGLVATIGAAVVYGRQSSRMVSAFQMSLAIVRIADPREAEMVIRECTRALADPRLPADRRTLAELNRARAQTMLALRRGHGHELKAALATLRRLLQDPALHPAAAVLAASDLVEAMSLAAEQTRDPQGYDEAQHLLEQCRNRASGIEISTRLAAHRASFAVFLARAGDPSHYGPALAQLEKAVSADRTPSAPDLANLGVMLSLSASVIGADRSDDAIDYCSKALAESHDDDETLFPVAQCLVQVANYRDSGSAEMRAEARAILDRLAGRKGILRLRAKQLLADLDRQP